jgi:hypothetical protein
LEISAMNGTIEFFEFAGAGVRRCSSTSASGEAIAQIESPSAPASLSWPHHGGAA